VLELGPGDHLGFALCLMAWGAESVTALDRFVVLHDSDRQRQIYQAIGDRFDGPARDRLQQLLTDDGAICSERVKLLAGLAIEDAAQGFASGSFDLILSVAVAEHLRDVERSFATMDGLLASGGVQLHQIDLSPDRA